MYKYKQQCILVFIISIFGMSINATEIPVEDINQIIIDLRGDSEKIKSFYGEFIQYIEKEPLSDDVIEKRVNKIPPFKNNNPNATAQLESREKLKEDYKNSHLQFRKFRVWRKGTKQRVDQIMAHVEKENTVLNTPFSQGVTFINTGNGKESYTIDHNAEYILHDLKSKWKPEDDLFYFIMPFRGLSQSLENIGLSTKKLTVKKDLEKSNQDQDTILIQNTEDTNAPIIEYSINWSSNLPRLNTMKMLFDDKLIFETNLENYQFDESSDIYYPTDVTILQNNPITNSLKSLKEYHLNELIINSVDDEVFVNPVNEYKEEYEMIELD